MNEILFMLKINLGITTTAYDERLTAILNAAVKMVAEEGATLNLTDVQDMQILVMYAEWLWRKRDSGEGMPRMLRYALNNRVLREQAYG